MNTHNLLRLVHIVGGMLWVGFAVFVATFLIPSIRAAGPSGGAVMREVAGVRKLPMYMMIISWATLLSGITLMYRDMGTMGARWFEQGSGLVFGIGAGFALVASVIGMAVSSPTARRLGALSAQLGSAGRPPSADEQQQLQAMQTRLFSASRWAALFLLLAAMAMASARYWG